MSINIIKKSAALFTNKIMHARLHVYRRYYSNNTILLKYWDYTKNWGDTVNPYLIQKLTGRQVVSSNTIFNYLGKPELLGIGSIIGGDLSNYVIWGSGVLSERMGIVNKPKEVLALRGLNSLKRIKEVGGNCNVFGDPALLFPDIFPGTGIEKKFRYGIVPHFKDKSSAAIVRLGKLKDSGIKVIDIQTDVEQFAIDILSCENIISSSLHGLVLAEAYGIPTSKIKLSDKLYGGDYKFYDYYSGVGIKNFDTIILNEDISNLKEAFDQCALKDIRVNKNELTGSLMEYLNRGNKS